MGLGDRTDTYDIVYHGQGGDFVVCLKDKNATFFKDQDAIETSLPLLFRQIVAITIVSSALSMVLRPFHQPRFVADITAGILLGPSAISKYRNFIDQVFPFASAPILESFTYLGGVYYIFLVGLEMNQTPILRIGKKSVVIAVSGILVPLAVGFCSFYVITPSNRTASTAAGLKGAFLWGVTLTGTNLPELTRILSDLKLLRMDIGRTALSSAFLSEIGTWLFLAIVMMVARTKILYVAISSIGFILLSIFAVRPGLMWLIRKTSDPEEDYKESHVRYVLCGVLLFGFITDGLGLTSLFGAFMFGFILPGGHLAMAVRERLEKVTSWILIPLYCMLIGLRCNVLNMFPKEKSFAHLMLFMVISWAAKFIATFLVSLRYGTKPREAFTLGVLMNTKGLLSVFVLNIGRDYRLLVVENFTMMILTVVVMTMTVPLIIKHAYKHRKRTMVHKYRTIQSTGIDSPLRILMCIHSTRNIRGSIYLLQLSQGTRQYPIRAFAVHLVELTERTSATMLVIQDSYRSSSSDLTRAAAKAESEQIVEAFEDYESQSDNAFSFEALTALSPYTTMHVDICSIAEDKRTNIIIIPFHVQGDKNIKADDMNSSVRMVNQNVLAYAPCSVGLLVNRGLGMSNQGVSCIILFFIGGPDDREALSYAWRMSALPEVHLTVVRFIPGEHAQTEETYDILNDEHDPSKLMPMQKRQADLDQEFIGEFKFRNENNNSITYSEETVNNGEETMKSIKNIMEQDLYDMCITGQGDGRTSPLVSGLSGLVEFQEMGAIGDAIVTSNFASNTSVLIIQQFGNHALRGRKGGGQNMFNDLLG
ncbi:hypothetical protein MLD38_009944 [Melastoma candidum]|uniref:Uncharacterized protein n=1 Tax=Melastoma candidum TaxID=119954 RepID=A0ACB9R1C8_9MYRT|nr:hypothetical protein MLD38_009944 [Melastoma candidum]